MIKAEWTNADALQPTCNQLATDCISRQAAIDALEESKVRYFDRRAIIGKMQDIINGLPSAQPEQKKGKWIDETFEPWGLVHHPYRCDQCGEHSECNSEYCPNCGAKMDDGDIPMEYFENGGI